MGFLRRIRGVIGTAITWGAFWGITMMLIVVGVEVFGSGRTDNFGRMLLVVSAWYAVIGAWAGSVFALFMAVSERRRTFAELSTLRVVLWGIAGSVSLPLTLYLAQISDVLRYGLPAQAELIILFTAVMGALSAWSMLAIARRARSQEPELLSAGPEDTPHQRTTEADRVAR